VTPAPEPEVATPSRLRRPSSRLPYFDPILAMLSLDEAEFVATSGLHVHWGYWHDPCSAHRSADDFARAQELMSRHLCDLAGVEAGEAVLDAGCGFGGTVASLNERLGGVTLIGINTDERQVSRARRQVVARPGNSVGFVVGDACTLPFADASFEHVLAVECIMHFPSRLNFMREARRVLRPGGQLTISDFSPIVSVPKPLTRLFGVLNSSVSRTYGPSDITYTCNDYHRLAKESGFRSMTVDDITLNTLPTYPVVRRLIRKAIGRETDWVTFFLEWLSRSGIVRYLILSFSAEDE